MTDTTCSRHCLQLLFSWARKTGLNPSDLGGEAKVSPWEGKRCAGHWQFAICTGWCQWRAQLSALRRKLLKSSGRLSILTRKRKYPGKREKQKPLEVNPVDEGAHIQNLILCFSSYCLCGIKKGVNLVNTQEQICPFICNHCNRARRPKVQPG